MHVESDLRVGHDPGGNLICVLGIKTSFPIDGGKFFGLGLRIVPQRLAFDLKLSLDQFVLGPHAYPFAGRHGDSTGQQSTDPSEAHERAIRGCAGDSQDQCNITYEPVTDTEDGCSSVATLHVTVRVHPVIMEVFMLAVVCVSHTSNLAAA